MPTTQRLASAVALVLLSILPGSVGAQDAPLAKEEQIRFLTTADVVSARQTSKGITHPWRLTLSDGRIRHDALFQSIDERKSVFRAERAAARQVNFVDSYMYNIAAFQLAELLGLDDMVPVTVERSWRGKGALSWWVDDVKMDEGDRLKQQIAAPDTEAWNRQMHKVRLFTELVYDTDPNVGNLVITNQWRIWRVDFTRAFRLWHDLQNPGDIVRCDRRLLERLKQLTEPALEEKTKRWLSKGEMRAVLARRDKIVARIEKLIAERGEDAVLY